MSANDGNGRTPPSLAGLPMASLQGIVAGRHEGPDWLIEGLIPQGCFLLTGRPKIGKSFFNLQLALTLAMGGQFLGFNALGNFEVVYIAAEDDPGRLSLRFQQYRIAQAPANLRVICRDDLKRLAAAFAETYTLAQFIDGLLCENPAIRAVIVDTESTVRAAWDGGSQRHDFNLNRNDYAEVREFDEVAHRRRAFIALVNHTAKRRDGRYFDVHELINRTNTAAAGASGSIVIADIPTNDPLAEQRDKCKILGVRGRDILHDKLLAVKQDDYAVFESMGEWVAHLQSETEEEILEALEELTKAAFNDNPDTAGRLADSAVLNADTAPWVTSKQLAALIDKKSGSIQRTLSRMMARLDKRTWKNYRIESSASKGYRLVCIVGNVRNVSNVPF